MRKRSQNERLKKGLSTSLVATLTFLAVVPEAFTKPLTEGVRLVYLGELEIGEIYVHKDGTVINFPTKPDVHVGKNGSFDIAFTGNDLIVSPKNVSARTNLFIYVLGRRYTIKLISTPARLGDQIVSLRDKSEKSLEVEIR